MKRFFTLLLIVSLFLLAGCQSAPLSEEETTPNTTKPATQEEKTTYQRLKRVTVTYDNMTVECDITWDNGVCNFESYMNYYKDDVVDFQGIFDQESKIYSMVRVSDNLTLPIFQYDDNQTVVKIFNEDKPTESWDISYTESMVPILQGKELFEYDPQARTVKRSIGSGETNGVKDMDCLIYTLNEDNTFKKVTAAHYVDDGTGNFVLDKEDDNAVLFTFDKKGNLIRYEEPNNDGLVIVFEYYDESIAHAWERTIPIHYIDIFDIYIVPFLFDLK